MQNLLPVRGFYATCCINYEALYSFVVNVRDQQSLNHRDARLMYKEQNVGCRCSLKLLSWQRLSVLQADLV